MSVIDVLCFSTHNIHILQLLVGPQPTPVSAMQEVRIHKSAKDCGRRPAAHGTR